MKLKNENPLSKKSRHQSCWKYTENCSQVSIHSIRTRHQILTMYHTIVEHHQKKICHRSGIDEVWCQLCVCFCVLLIVRKKKKNFTMFWLNFIFVNVCSYENEWKPHSSDHIINLKQHATIKSIIMMIIIIALPPPLKW